MGVSLSISTLTGSYSSSLNMLSQHQSSTQTALERLSTGKRVNRASDDPSAVAPISEAKFRMMQIEKRIDAFGRETARLGATEGGLAVVQDLLLEAQGLVVNGANTGALGDGELEAIQTELSSVLAGINQLAASTSFEGNQILIGNDAASLGIAELATQLAKDPESAQKTLEAAIDSVAGQRAGIGNRLNTIDGEIEVLSEEFAGQAEVLSSLEDADFAKETADLVRSQILEQATIKSILIQRDNAERVLDLIDGSAIKRGQDAS